MKQTNSSWNAGRFLQTLTYFDVIPVISWLQRLFNRSMASQPISVMPPQANTILVVGATGTLSQQVAEQLVQQGERVRVVVAKAQSTVGLLGDRIDAVAADINRLETLTAVVCDGIKAVIYVSETPHRQNIQNLINAVAPQLKTQTGEKTLFDFAANQLTPSFESTWGPLDDVVMGGVSASSFLRVEDSAVFTGAVSTVNSGGFASVRSRNFQPALDLSNYDGIRLRVKGDGKRYKFLIRSDDKWDSIAYSYSFDTLKNQWLDVSIPFQDLIPVFRAKTIPNSEPINSGHICSFQLMLSKFEYDGALNPNFVPGAFSLEVCSINAYSKLIQPQFILIAVRSGDHTESALNRPWLKQSQTAISQSGIPYAILCFSGTEYEPSSVPISQAGSTESEINAQEVAILCLQALRSPKARNVMLEISAENSATLDLNDLLTKFAASH